jgi:hypothetical protein
MGQADRLDSGRENGDFKINSTPEPATLNSAGAQNLPKFDKPVTFRIGIPRILEALPARRPEIRPRGETR